MAFAAPAAYAPGILATTSTATLARLVLLIFCIAFTVENLQDIRDIREDKEASVVTLLSGLGVPATTRVLLVLQLVSGIIHCTLAKTAALPLRLDLLAVYACCGVCTVAFRENTPRSLFQVVLEPLYVVPLAVAALRMSLFS